MIVTGMNLNLINTLTFIKTTFTNIFLNKRLADSYSFRDQLSMNTMNINNPANSNHTNKQTK